MKPSELLIVFVTLSVLCLSNGEEVNLRVEAVTAVARTDDSFICATLDWWPSNKCDYGQCPWGKAGLLNLDLKNKILINAIKAFNPLRIRIGGSLEDQVTYKVGKGFKDCPHFKKENYLFGFSRGCLTMNRWDELNNLFNETGVLLTFGLNALYGRRRPARNDTPWIGNWGTQNARDLMAYSVSKGYKIDSYELGNELCGDGVSARVDAQQYGKDMIALKELVKEMYPDRAMQPKILGPAGFYDKKWFDTLLQVSGPGVVDGLTHHIYNLGPGVDPTLIDKVQNPYFLDQTAQVFKDISRSVDLYGPWAGAWVGEAGGAYNSGGKDVSHTFANSFWYLDQLGMTSTFNNKVYCRQSLIGGNYGLLNTTSFIPNPDYYGALLWNRLMGRKVLAASHRSSPYLRIYCHCSKKTPGITLLVINMSNSTTFNISIIDDMNLYPRPRKLLTNDGDQHREEYHLKPENGNIQSDVLLLNGIPLKLTESLDIPDLNPELVDPTVPITVTPDSIVFATLKGFNAPACS